MKNIKKQSLFLLIFLLQFPFHSAFAATYYVDKSHPEASDSNSGSSAKPWRTIQKAANTLQPGDKVLVRAGTYTELNFIEPNIAYAGIKPKNSGTDIAPITYEAYPGEKVIIDQQYQGSGFFLTGVHNITIRGFEITKAKEAGIFLLFGDCRNIVIESNHIHDVRDEQGANVGGVRLDGAVNPVVRNNVIHNVYTTVKKDAGVHSFGMTNAIIENNKIYDVDYGVFQKRSNGNKGAIVRRNLIYDANIGILYSVAGGNDAPHVSPEIYENIMITRDEGVLANAFETAQINTGFKIFNNTIISRNSIVLSWVKDVEMHSNIFVSNLEEFISRTHGQCDKIVTFESYDRNLYAGSTRFMSNQYCGTGNQQYEGLASWRAATGYDINSKSTANKEAVFVNFNSGDYRLKSDSLAKALGKDGNDAGAYGLGATVIGPVDELEGATPPSAPTGLQVVN